MTESRPIRTAVLGYGLAGRVFHTPAISDLPEFSLDAILTFNRNRAAQAHERYPLAKVYPSVDAILEQSANLDLVVIATPPDTHHPFAAAALDRGLHVVVDKPFVADMAQGQDLIQRAAAAERVLTVFQNRRWDGDFLTIRRLLADGHLGQVHTFEARWESWKPAGLGGWKSHMPAEVGGGLLADLGTHLIDQAIQLFGPVAEVYGETRRHSPPPGVGPEDDAFVSLRHAIGVRSHIYMNYITGLSTPRYRVLGAAGTYEKWGLDPQEAALNAGAVPSEIGYGLEAPENWGVLGTMERQRAIPTEPGNYAEFYRMLARAIEGGPPPVDPAQALEVMRIIMEVHRQVQARSPGR